jgi:hypothetical protein
MESSRTRERCSGISPSYDLWLEGHVARGPANTGPIRRRAVIARRELRIRRAGIACYGLEFVSAAWIFETLSFEGVYVSCSTHGKPGDAPRNPGSPVCAGIRHNPKWNAVTAYFDGNLTPPRNAGKRS